MICARSKQAEAPRSGKTVSQSAEAGGSARARLAARIRVALTVALDHVRVLQLLRYRLEVVEDLAGRCVALELEHDLRNCGRRCVRRSGQDRESDKRVPIWKMTPRSEKMMN